MREFEGTDLPEALAAAAAALGVPEASLRYELVEEGRRGILGLGARPTRIRVTVDGAIAADPVRPAPRRSSDMDRASLEDAVPNVREADEDAGAGGADLADIRETVLTLFRLAGFALEDVSVSTSEDGGYAVLGGELVAE